MSDSKESTFSKQAELPRLPLPSLEDTVAKMVRSAAIFQDDAAREHTAAVAKEFLAGAGPELHSLLEARASEERNWLEEWWERFVYLMPRSPTAVLVNWWGCLPGNWGKFSVCQSQAAAMLTKHLLSMRLSLIDGSFPIEKMAGQPLCMHQFSRAFNTCRIPRRGEDELRIEELGEGGSRHVVVLRNGAMYKVDVVDERGRPLEYAELLGRFQLAIDAGSDAFAKMREPNVSLLTSQERDVWAAEREHLQEIHRCNAESLEIIETALFVLALEEGSEPTLEKRAFRNLCGHRGRDRWFDKPFNLILYEDATGGINGEHSWADAMVIVSIFDNVLRTLDAELDSSGIPSISPSDAAKRATQTPKKLEWELDARARQAVELASAHVGRLIKRADLKVLEFPHYGKDFLKRYRLIPDSFVQLAIQLAYWRCHRKIVATYESAHTRLFYHGRTETIRTTCQETVDFCKAMDVVYDDTDIPAVSSFSAAPTTNKDEEDPSSSSSKTPQVESVDSRRYALLKDALLSHRSRGKDALLGQGIDRHLFGLYVAAEIMGMSPKPALFTDPGIVQSRTYVLSTSNISMQESAMIGGFAPITTDGIGVCYGIQGHMLQFSICTDASCTETSAEKFRDALTTALMDMQHLVTSREHAYLADAKL